MAAPSPTTVASPLRAKLALFRILTRTFGPSVSTLVFRFQFLEKAKLSPWPTVYSTVIRSVSVMHRPRRAKTRLHRPPGFPCTLALVALSCGAPQTTEAPPTPAVPTQAAASPAPPAASGQPAVQSSNRCGALDCRTFPSAVAALSEVLAEKPVVLGVGEAHALKGMEHIPSTTKRFTDDFLPVLKGKTSDLIVELMLPNAGCEAKKQEVAKRQEAVTKPQAESNQNQYLVLGQTARKHGIAPDILRPTCEDLTRITEAGSGDVGVMLETIARLAREKVEHLLTLNEKDGRKSMVVAYGGALHNDIAAREGREAWTFGPALTERTGGRYVELDLIVPEFIKDSETWRALPWYPHYDRKKLGGSAVLFRVAPNSYVLVFPETAPAKPTK